MKKITIKKQKDCSGCLFLGIDCEKYGAFAKKLTGFDCSTEDVIFVYEEPKYRACENAVEAARFLGKRIYDKYTPISHYISAISNVSFIESPNSVGDTHYEYICFKSAFEFFTLKDGSPVGVKEEK